MNLQDVDVTHTKTVSMKPPLSDNLIATNIACRIDFYHHHEVTKKFRLTGARMRINIISLTMDLFRSVTRIFITMMVFMVVTVTGD